MSMPPAVPPAEPHPSECGPVLWPSTGLGVCPGSGVGGPRLQLLGAQRVPRPVDRRLGRRTDLGAAAGAALAGPSAARGWAGAYRLHARAVGRPDVEPAGTWRRYDAGSAQRAGGRRAVLAAPVDQHPVV